MKTLTEKEWKELPDEEKRAYNGSRYMIFKEPDDWTCFEAVEILKDDYHVDLKGFINSIKGNCSKLFHSR